MVKIINGKRYNTETATRLFENGTGSTANFSDWYEIFYEMLENGDIVINFTIKNSGVNHDN